MTPLPPPEDRTLPQIRLFDMISALSTALDLLDPALVLHQKRTCLIAAHIARHLNLSNEDYENVFGAAIFHDIGAIRLAERIALLEFEENDAHTHAKLGALLLARYPDFCRYAPLVRGHHLHWANGVDQQLDGVDVPLLSHLIYLADRIEVIAQGCDNILASVEYIVSLIQQNSGDKFYPPYVDAFAEVAKKESFWLDIFSSNLDRRLKQMAPFENIKLNINQLLLFAQFIALVIDSRSHFTATHSAGVAITAEILANHLGMNSLDCTKIRMAGYLHDLGKLAIPNELIEYHGALNEAETARVKTHSYLTFDILNGLTGLGDVAQWAGFHHERLDGSGYPFHKTADELPLGARIMAIADVYTALTEDRPYRAGLKREAVLQNLSDQVQNNKLDARVFSTLQLHIYEIETACAKAQLFEGMALDDFWAMNLPLSMPSPPSRDEICT